MRLKKVVLLISLILVSIGVAGAIYFTYSVEPYTIKSKTLTSADGTQLASWVYAPKRLFGSAPGIVVCHGFMANKQTMQGISLELAKCGFVVIAIDFRGHGQSGGNLGEERNLYGEASNKLIDDVYAAVQYLKSLPSVDNNSIGLVGHSMGGASVMGAAIAYQDEISATVSIGMVGINDSLYEINGTAISNLLIAMGALEEIFTEEHALNFLKNATGLSTVEAGQLYGSHEYGNATKLYIAPWADHILEISDTGIMNEICTWFRSSFYTGATLAITDNWRQMFIILATLGSVLGFYVFVPYVKPLIFKNKPENAFKVDKPSQKKILYYLGGYAVASIIAFLLVLPLSNIFQSSINLIMSNYLIGLFMGYAAGLFIMFFIFHRYIDKNPRSLIGQIKTQISHNFYNAVLFGFIIFLFSFGSLTAVLHWSLFDLFPTAREWGAMISVAFLLFPYVFLDQLYIRKIESHITKGRIKELFKVVLLSSLIKTAVFIPLLFLNLGFISLVIMILIIAFPGLEMLATWIYIYSGRNIISPTIYITLLLSWVLVQLMPFGNYAYVML